MLVTMDHGCIEKLNRDKPNKLIKSSRLIEVARYNIKFATIKNPMGPKVKPRLPLYLIILFISLIKRSKN